jgi:hypothetical protein
MYYFLILFLTLFELQLFLIIKILRHYFPLRFPECPIQFRLCTFIIWDWLAFGLLKLESCRIDQQLERSTRANTCSCSIHEKDLKLLPLIKVKGNILYKPIIGCCQSNESLWGSSAKSKWHLGKATRLGNLCKPVRNQKPMSTICTCVLGSLCVFTVST